MPRLNVKTKDPNSGTPPTSPGFAVGPGMRQSGSTLYAEAHHLHAGLVMVYLVGTDQVVDSSGSSLGPLGDGVYRAVVVRPPTGKSDPGAALTQGAVGDVSAKQFIYVQNPAEIDGVGHMLDVGTPTSFAWAKPTITTPDGKVLVYTMVPAAAPTLLPVLLSNAQPLADTAAGSGSAGSSGVHWSYTLTRLNGQQLATQVPLRFARYAGAEPTNPGTRGFAVYRAGDAAGSGFGSTGAEFNGFPADGGSGSGAGGSGTVYQPWELWIADETVATIECPTSSDSGSASDDGGI